MRTYNTLTQRERLKLFFSIESTGFFRYWFEQAIVGLFGWIPSLVGIVLRMVAYRAVLNAKGPFVIQSGAILKQAANLTLHKGAYLDHRVYIHACPNGVEIGENSRIMYNAELHVYNFRDLPNSGIFIGKNSIVGPYNIIMGHGGTYIGNDVGLAPRVSILPINHYYTGTDRPFLDQDIEAKGIVIEDNVWVGAGATILDGVRIGTGSVVGAGATVTKDVPPKSLAVGSPARVIRTWEKS